MKVSTSSMLQTYLPNNTKKPIAQKSEDKPGARSLKNDGKTDKVNISQGFSIQRINSMLTTEIGKKVDKMLTEAGVDIRQAAGLDWSPEATAGRIFDMTSGLIDVWRRQHPEMSEEEVIDSFEKTVRGAVDEGYTQAMSILAGAGLDNQVGDVAEQTIGLVHEKFDSFFENLRQGLENTTETAPEQTETEK